MTLLESIIEAKKAINRVERQIRIVRAHAARVFRGNPRVIPFEFNKEQLQKFYGRYAETADALGSSMRQLGAQLPEDREYSNVLGWAVALDVLNRQVSKT